MIPPNALILFNNDLVDDVRAYIVKQLYISEAITGTEFDARIAANPDYPILIKQLNLRIMVERSFKELNNRELFDLILFLKNGLVSAECRRPFANFPPGLTFPLKDLYWGKFGIFLPY